MRRLRTIWVSGLASVTVGCGSLGGGGGGGEGLPNRGIAGYVLVEEPAEASGEGSAASTTVRPQYVITNADGPRYVESSAWVHDGVIEMVAERRIDRERAIVWFRSTDGGATWSDPVAVIDGASLPEAWEADGELAAPSLLREGDQWVIAFAYGDDAGIGLAQGPSLDALVVAAEPLLVASESWEADGVWSPSIIRHGDERWLYYVTEGTEPGEDGSDVDTGRRIALARIAADGSVTRVGGVLDSSICGELDASDCPEADGPGSPEVRLARTPTGRDVFRMFYSAGDDGIEALVFAASHDGIGWSRFPYNPILDEARFDEYGATNVVIGDEYVLFYTREPNRGTRGIVRAVNALGNVADRW